MVIKEQPNTCAKEFNDEPLLRPGYAGIPYTTVAGAQQSKSGGQFNWGSAPQIAGAAGSILNAYNTANQKLNLGNQQIAPSQIDQNSAPTYTAGGAYNEAHDAEVNKLGAGEVAAGTAQGFASGGPIGAAVGFVSSIVGGMSREEAQRKAKRDALRRAMAAQQQYNQQDVTFRGQQNQQRDYLRRINPYNREYVVNQTRFY